MKIIIVGPSPKDRGGIASLLKIIINKSNNSFDYTMHVARPAGNLIVKFLLIPIYTLYFFLRVLIKKFDIVHVNFSENWGFYRYVPVIFWSKFLRIKIVLHSHSFEFDKFYNKQNKILKNIIRKTLNISDSIVVLSEEWAKVFRSISFSKIQIIHNFIEVPSENNYNSNSKFITTTGILGKRKGYYDLALAIPEILRINNEIKFNFCGNGEIEEVVNTLKELNVYESVNLTGWVEKDAIQEILKNTVLYVLPSYGEGMPMGIIEAMGFGIPIVSTKVGGIPSLVKDGINGLLIESW